MKIKGMCRTTSMGILPHIDEGKAMSIALSLDIPFWPQLPLKDFKEDMWVQFTHHFPGIIVDYQQKKVRLDTERFYSEVGDYSLSMEDMSFFEIKESHSVMFHRFIRQDLSHFYAIRGQVTGPLNLGFRILDEKERPIIYNEDIRALLFDYVKKKIISQHNLLLKKNPRSFVWIDEPAIAWTFSSFSGYTDKNAQRDLREMFENIPHPRALHLCINMDMGYLIELGIDILSIEAYQMDIFPRAYALDAARFLKKGNIISWGIVPTVSVFLDIETPASLCKKLLSYWHVIEKYGKISLEEIAASSLIAPARCCLKNADLTNFKLSPSKKVEEISQGIEEALMEKALDYTREISYLLKTKFSLDS